MSAPPRALGDLTPGSRESLSGEEAACKRVVGGMSRPLTASPSTSGPESRGLVGESGCGKTDARPVYQEGSTQVTGERSTSVARWDAVRARRDRGHPAPERTREQERELERIDAPPDRQALRQDWRVSPQLSGRFQALQLAQSQTACEGNRRATAAGVEGGSGEELTKRVVSLIESVGTRTRASVRYPHSFSGGQRQRISTPAPLLSTPSSSSWTSHFGAGRVGAGSDPQSPL